MQVTYQLLKIGRRDYKTNDVYGYITITYNMQYAWNIQHDMVKILFWYTHMYKCFAGNESSYIEAKWIQSGT